MARDATPFHAVTPYDSMLSGVFIFDAARIALSVDARYRFAFPFRLRPIMQIVHPGDGRYNIASAVTPPRAG